MIETWDASKYINTKADIRQDLRWAFKDGKREIIAMTLKDIIKATGGVTRFSNLTGLTNAGIYKIINGKADPTFSSLQKIMKAFNLEITIK